MAWPQALRPCRLHGQELRRGLERNKTLNRVHGARWQFPNVYRTPEGAFRPYCKSTETNTNWPSPLNEANRIRASGLQSYGGNAPDSRPTLGRCGPCHTTRFAFRAVEPCKVDLTLVPGHPREQLACLSVPDVYRTVPPRSRLGAVWTVLVVKGGLRFFPQLAYLGSVFGVPNLDGLFLESWRAACRRGYRQRYCNRQRIEFKVAAVEEVAPFPIAQGGVRGPGFRGQTCSCLLHGRLNQVHLRHVLPSSAIACRGLAVARDRDVDGSRRRGRAV